MPWKNVKSKAAGLLNGIKSEPIGRWSSWVPPPDNQIDSVLSARVPTAQKQKENCMKNVDVEKDQKLEESKQREGQRQQDSIFDTEEIEIEELAIDGICGVY